jgi:hypothetical protein
MKLIDWAGFPIGAALVNNTDKSDQYVGEFIGWVTTKTALIKRLKYSDSMRIFTASIAPFLTKKLRLAPARQQPWLVYEEGATVVPEWADCEHRGFSRFTQRVEKDYKKYAIDYAAHFRIIGIKEGLTDNPDEVTK